MKNPDNLLNNETSPYLLQHANNPVNWHPWNQAALEKAKTENKPILLSIGYSACHWCHVMAHESFEDEKTAKIMNQHFINIKVDREERPDLDKIYQTAHSLLTSRSGGWPLTVFLSPINQMPFFAGTYFPDNERHNLPSFSQIMYMVADAYINKKQEIEQQNGSISNILKDISDYTPNNSALNSLPLDLCRKQLDTAFDIQNGGFSPAPKFPHTAMIERCMRHYLLLKSQHKIDQKALQIATYTLDKMALGGFQDQLGGGFFRYSTDEHWMIPHFEKMLYDNAQLLTLYSQAYRMTNSSLYRQTIERAADWCQREMQTSEGGYCSALDADTDKIEGKTYTWSPNNVKVLLSEDEYEVFSLKFNLTKAANFEDNWHLHSEIGNQSLAEQLKIDLTKLEKLLHNSIQKLLAERETRNQPGRDNKILCAWNALMIRGMSQAGRRTDKPQYINSAIKAAEFIYDNLWKNHRLLASFKDGKAHLNAYLDDYAYLLQALIELLQSKWSLHHYQWAIEIANSMLANFEDKDQGGFFFTSHDHEQLLYRSKTFSDDAMPNGNAVAANSLLQLGLLCGDTKYLDAAERTIRCGYNSLSEQALTHCSLLHALEVYLNQGLVIILRGNDEDLHKWKLAADHRFIPHLTSIAIDRNEKLPAALEDKKPLGETCAYICEGTHCLPVITDYSKYLEYLNNLS